MDSIRGGREYRPKALCVTSDHECICTPDETLQSRSSFQAEKYHF